MIRPTGAEIQEMESKSHTEVQRQLRRDFERREKQRHPKAFTKIVPNLPSRIAAGGPKTLKLVGCRWRLPEYTGEGRRSHGVI